MAGRCMRSRPRWGQGCHKGELQVEREVLGKVAALSFPVRVRSACAVRHEWWNVGRECPRADSNYEKKKTWLW